MILLNNIVAAELGLSDKYVSCEAIAQSLDLITNGRLSNNFNLNTQSIESISWYLDDFGYDLDDLIKE